MNRRTSRAMRLILAALLRLFPVPFRRAFGDDMLATFEDRWRERGSWRLAIRTILDLIVNAIIERFSDHAPAVEPVKNGDSPMAILWQDFRFALRTLRNSPAFTLVALATLALGIGVNTAMFSVANAVLWRSLPYPDPDKVVWVGEVTRANPDIAWGASYINFGDWRARSHSFERMAGILSWNSILLQGAEPARVSGLAVTREFFEILGAQPALGRGFAASDEKRNAPPVMLLSDRMWRSRFAGDPAILGRAVEFDDGAWTVIGIMPPGFEYREAEFWVPLDPVINPYFAGHRDVWVMNSIARLRPGVTVGAAQTELEAIAVQIRRDHPETNRDLVMRVSTLRKQFSLDLQPALLALLGAVAVVLLIACANLAGLMSVRASGRARELAIRSALGAGRRRMIRQLLTECLTLAVCGGAVGIGLAFWTTRGLQWLSKDPRLLGVAIDFKVLLFAIAATLITSLLFGIAPAIHASRVDAADALKTGPRSGAGPQRALARQVLVVAQVALCLVLLVGAGLLLRSFRRVLDVNPGFRADHLSSMRILLPNSYKSSNGYNAVAAVVQVDARFVERLKSLPGVVDATMVNSLPISGGDPSGDITVEGVVSAPGGLGGASFRRALPGYFHAMGIPLIRGRDFTPSDDAQHEQVIIINESMARRFWPDQDPIGRRIKLGPRDSSEWDTIIGVVRDVRHVGLDADAGFSTYQPVAQQPRLQMEIAIRTAGDPQMVIAAAQRELRSIEPALMIDKVETMAQRVDDSVAPRRLNLVLFGLFSLLALVLAAVGLYGVVAYAAGQRTQEFGIRMAMGAESADVLRLVLGQGLKLALAGVVIGTAAALALTRLLTTLLFEVQPADPLTIVAVSILLALVATVACWIPAYRATRIAPLESLRAD
jgi:putative ABC transport system permease protein